MENTNNEVAYGVIEMTTKHDRMYNNFQVAGIGVKSTDVAAQAEYECHQLL